MAGLHLRAIGHRLAAGVLSLEGEWLRLRSQARRTGREHEISPTDRLSLCARGIHLCSCWMDSEDPYNASGED